ncbi:MAG TPA: hypothetical protein VK558_10480, partial [Patescibacteria group bacterium]|nr:hypothetical protein [Patescibacteria group bacterium]
MTVDYLLCGWRVRSGLPLPELLPWTGPQDAPPDIVIDEAPVPERLDNPVSPGKYLMVNAEGAALLHIAGLVRILVQGGCRMTVERLRPDGSDPVWRLFLLGSALGILCLQRGLYPLHAASLRVGGRVLAIAARSGGGKSTLALALTRRGHGLLSDDVAVLKIQPQGVELLPAFPRLKLWRDTLNGLDIDAANLPRVRDGLEKYDLRPSTGFDPSPTRLDAILTLAEGPELALRRTAATAAIPAVHAHVSRPRAAVYLGRQASLFAQTAMIARS